MQLPYSDRPWAKQLAVAVIVLAVAASVAAYILLHARGPLDTAEKTAIALFLIAIIPPNIAIIRRKPGAVRESHTGRTQNFHHARPHIR